MFNTYAQLAGSPDFFARDVSRYRAISPTSLQDAASRYLPKTNRIVVFVEPNTQAPRAGRVKGGK